MKIVEAVAPLKEESIKRAVEFMTKKIDKIVKLFEEHEWDINAVAPRPAGRL